jgi:hypothetical protein
LSATGAATVAIRDAVPEDAVAACGVLRASISRLCVADHHNDPAIRLRGWPTTGNARRKLISTETAHHFYQSAGYRDDDSAPTGRFGTSLGYPMSRESSLRDNP